LPLHHQPPRHPQPEVALGGGELPLASPPMRDVLHGEASSPAVLLRCVRDHSRDNRPRRSLSPASLRSPPAPRPPPVSSPALAPAVPHWSLQLHDRSAPTLAPSLCHTGRRSLPSPAPASAWLHTGSRVPAFLPHAGNLVGDGGPPRWLRRSPPATGPQGSRRSEEKVEDGHEWMIGVSVSFSGSILHLKLTPNKLTP
jgi:hypothetical protein